MKNRKRAFFPFGVVVLIVTVITGTSIQKAEASDEMGFQPRVMAGWLNYSLDYDPSLEVGNLSWKFSDNMPVIGVGATFFWKKFYLDLQYQHTAEGNSGLSSGTFLPAGRGLPFEADATFSGDSDFYHWNYSITVGYQLFESFSLYTGYKHNETNFEMNIHASFRMIDDGSITGMPGFPIEQNFMGDFDIDYEAKGPFIGASYGYRIGDKGVLSFNFAVALLDGDITQAGVYVNARTGVPVPGVFDISSSGDSIGISYGVGWRSMLTERIGFSISANGYNYDFDADKSSQSDFQEVVYSATVGLSYAF